jgi:hypothetical protein
MSRFIVIHDLAAKSNADEWSDLVETRKQLVRRIRGTPVQWLRGWWDFNKTQQICEYEAPDVEAIRRAVTESGLSDIFPIAQIDEVYPNGPTDFPGEFEEA